MFEKAELSEFSDNYPLKTDPETIDFKGFWKGYRRNGISPTKGIDTDDIYISFFIFGHGRNGISPTKGIDTASTNKIVIYNFLSRNGISPTKGIDTVVVIHSFLSFRGL